MPPPPSCDTKPWFCAARLVAHAPLPPATQSQRFALCKSCMCCTRGLCDRWGGLPPSRAIQNHGVVSQAGGGAFPLCYTADMSAVSHSRHACCVTQQTCMLCHTADMSVASHSRHVSHRRHVRCVTRQSAVSRSRHVCGLMWTLGLVRIARDGSTWATSGGTVDLFEP